METFEAGGGDDDGVAASAHVLGHAQKPAARIFLERDEEQLALDLDLFGVERFFGDGRLVARITVERTGGG